MIVTDSQAGRLLVGLVHLQNVHTNMPHRLKLVRFTRTLPDGMCIEIGNVSLLHVLHLNAVVAMFSRYCVLDVVASILPYYAFWFLPPAATTTYCLP